MMAYSRQRRAFLTGHVRGQKPPIRPPWAIPETAFVTACTRCSQCITACPENIIQKGRGGFPDVNFAQGECTFCRQCVASCRDNALQPTATPWDLKAEINTDCLTFQHVVCMSCAESCEQQAIHFTATAYQVPQPLVDNALCTGCGACYQPCPTQAIVLCQKLT